MGKPLTLHDLSQLYWLEKEIKADKCRLRELEANAYGVSAVNLDGMPRSGTVGSKTERNAIAIAEIKRIIEEKQARCIEERRRLEVYIAGIEDSLTRQIYELRFVDGLSWDDVASRLGGGNTANSVKKTCYRHLEKSNKEDGQPERSNQADDQPDG